MEWNVFHIKNKTVESGLTVESGMKCILSQANSEPKMERGEFR